MASNNRLFVPGRNCWRLARADRFGYLIDGEIYFRVLREAMIGARHSIMIVGWDINSRFKLIRPPDDDGLPAELGAFLEHLVAHNEHLNVRILNWDFSLLFAMDREWLPGYKLGSHDHPRIHFQFDDQHAVGGSQHQKLVVIDNQLAFLGGLDITMGRWDTPEHRPDDPRRRDLGRTVPQPYHDVQVVFSGEAAGTVDELARERWHRATGRELPPQGNDRQPPWPDSAPVDLENVDIAVARTHPEYNDHEAIHEIERLMLDMVHAAGRYIYIENQYFTAGKVIDALIEKLQQDDGPEIVAVVPEHTNGWLSQGTMDVLREKQLGRLLEADKDNRFRMYYPNIPGLDDDCLNVHAKVTIIDDRSFRIGSANLNNRSLGLDSECDIAVDAETQPHATGPVISLRNRLLAEHLGTEPDTVDRAVNEHGSLIKAIESLRNDGRSLRPLPSNLNPELVEMIPDSQLLDPEKPLEPEYLLEEFVPYSERVKVLKRALPAAAVLAVLAGLAALWRWTPLSEATDIDKLISLVGAVETLPMTPLVTVAGFTAAATLGVPVTVLIIATLLVFGPLEGFTYSLSGSVLSAMLVYFVGRKTGGEVIRRITGGKVAAINERLKKHGLIAVIAVRVIPVAPFPVVNAVAGAANIHFGQYVLGTVLGMAPGLTAMTLFTESFVATLRQPTSGNIAVLVAVVAVIAVCVYLLRRWLNAQT